jgi:acetyltransferase-like isoleucine patch superfamily enzyme
MSAEQGEFEGHSSQQFVMIGDDSKNRNNAKRDKATNKEKGKERAVPEHRRQYAYTDDQKEMLDIGEEVRENALKALPPPSAMPLLKSDVRAFVGLSEDGSFHVQQDSVLVVDTIIPPKTLLKKGTYLLPGSKVYKSLDEQSDTSDASTTTTTTKTVCKTMTLTEKTTILKKTEILDGSTITVGSILDEDVTTCDQVIVRKSITEKLPVVLKKNCRLASGSHCAAGSLVAGLSTVLHTDCVLKDSLKIETDKPIYLPSGTCFENCSIGFDLTLLCQASTGQATIITHGCSALQKGSVLTNELKIESEYTFKEEFTLCGAIVFAKGSKLPAGSTIPKGCFYTSQGEAWTVQVGEELVFSEQFCTSATVTVPAKSLTTSQCTLGDDLLIEEDLVLTTDVVLMPFEASSQHHCEFTPCHFTNVFMPWFDYLINAGRRWLFDASPEKRITKPIHLGKGSIIHRGSHFGKGTHIFSGFTAQFDLSLSVGTCLGAQWTFCVGAQIGAGFVCPCDMVCKKTHMVSMEKGMQYHSGQTILCGTVAAAGSVFGAKCPLPSIMLSSSTCIGPGSTLCDFSVIASGSQVRKKWSLSCHSQAELSASAIEFSQGTTLVKSTTLPATCKHYKLPAICKVIEEATLVYDIHLAQGSIINTGSVFVASERIPITICIDKVTVDYAHLEKCCTIKEIVTIVSKTPPPSTTTTTGGNGGDCGDCCCCEKDYTLIKRVQKVKKSHSTQWPIFLVSGTILKQGTVFPPYYGGMKLLKPVQSGTTPTQSTNGGPTTGVVKEK